MTSSSRAQAAGSAAHAEEKNSERAAWDGSEVTSADLKWLHNSRRIPMGVQSRLPGDKVVTVPEEGERVVFLSHFERGFALPASEFFRSFLDFFGLQPHHLLANAILTLSAFVTCCEGYLGLWPSIALGSRYFMFRPQVIPDKENPDAPKMMTQCGAATIIPRRNSEFPKIQGLESCKKWHWTYFYVKNAIATDYINLPEFEIGPPEEKRNWSIDSKDSLPQTDEIHARILELKKAGMSTDDLLATFTYRRLCPLQRRDHKMCHYGGQFDPDKISTVKLSHAEVRRRVRAIAKTSMPEDWSWGMPAYARNRRAPKVSSMFLLLYIRIRNTFMPASI